MRRLIIIALEPGQKPEIDWEGEFEYWELLAALEKAHAMLEEQEYERDLEEELSAEDGGLDESDGF